MGIFLHIVGYAVCAVLLAATLRLAKGNVAADGGPVYTRGSAVGAGVWAALLFAWVVYNASGLVRCSAPWLPPLVSALLALTGCLTLIGPSIRRRWHTPLAVARPFVVALSLPAALFLLEWPYNTSLFSIDAEHMRLNLWLVGAGVLAVWFVLQRRNGSLLFCLAACLVGGLANYFLCLFKGQTILPADVLAISTAAEVSGGYDFVLYDSAAAALCVFLLIAAVLALLPSPRLARIKAAVNLIIGLAIAASLVNWYETHDIYEDYGINVDVWATRDSYTRFGSIPCFLQRMQEVEAEPPAGYDTQSAEELQASLARAWDESESGQARASRQEALVGDITQGDDEAPSVIAIMNESFSDLSLFEGIEGYDGVEGLWDMDGLVQSGLAYTSARGGGTCNSEFEFLTGSTLGSLGGGVYPYMFYDMSVPESLPRYFAAQGYGTTAIHPAEASNWRRDVVYGQMGFDEFISEDDFPADAPTLRDMISDRATYDMILDVLNENDGPQFVFDVTLQNHGGYDTGLLDEYPYDGVTVNGQSVEGMSEFLSCVDASVEDLHYLLDELSKLDRRVIVVFFGDHQPGFNDDLAQASTGTALGDMSLDQVQMRFATPYFIWANYDLGIEGAEATSIAAGNSADYAPASTADTRLDLSLGYLMAQTARVTGLPMTDYQKALLQLETQMPSVNLNGYQDDRRWWFWIGMDGPAKQAYDQYAILQYANLFDVQGNAAFARFENTGGQAGAA